MNQGNRLREERERLGYSQAVFAALAGASKNSQLNWEKGHSAPDADILAEWAKHGVDILYVVTGQRTTPVSETLSIPELSLLENYRRAPSARRKTIEAVASMASDTTAPQQTPQNAPQGDKST